MTDTKYTYWTHIGGWQTAAGDLDDRLGIPKDTQFWEDELKDAGWRQRHSPEGDLDCGITVYENIKTDDLFVVGDDIEDRLFSFLVPAADRHIFMATEYLAMRARWAQGEQFALQQRLTNALIAFVRHGHGESTISEDGTATREDRAREIRRVNEPRRKSA